MLVFIVNYGLM